MILRMVYFHLNRGKNILNDFFFNIEIFKMAGIKKYKKKELLIQIGGEV